MNKDSKIDKIGLSFWTFFKIGAFTFGGGYAMIPLISREVSENSERGKRRHLYHQERQGRCCGHGIRERHDEGFLLHRG